MGEFALRAPQIGEAVRKVGIVRYLKEIGQAVALDEPIVVVESDKAAFEIESPVPGVVMEVLHGEGIAVDVGAIIMKLRTATDEHPVALAASSAATRAPDEAASGSSGESAAEENLGAVPDCSAIGHGSQSEAPSAPAQAVDQMLSQLRNGILSPRERHQRRQARLAHEVEAAPLPGSTPAPAHAPPTFTDSPLSGQRHQLNRALVASQSQVVAANLQLSCPEGPMQAVRQRYRRQAIAPVPSRFELIAWTVVQAMKAHPLLRSRLLDTGVLRRHHDPGLGLAVALPNDELTTAVVPHVFVGEFAAFTTACRQAIARARLSPEPPAYHALAISDLSAYGIEDAIPVVVAPSTATLFIGVPRRDAGGERSFRLSLSFDHRILNGAGAAAFLNTVSRTLRSETRLQALLAVPAEYPDVAAAC